MLSKRISLISESNTSRMRNRANVLKKAGIPVINFAAGELDFDTSDVIKNAAIQAITQGQNKYTDTLGIDRLRTLIADKITSSTGVTYSIDEVGVVAGAKQGLFNTAMMILEPGDEVIIPYPCWGTFPAQVLLAGAKPIFLDTRDNQCQIDLRQLTSIITEKTKAIILNTPNNPTGVIYKQDILNEIAFLSIKNNFWIVFDECYGELTYPPNKHQNIVTICPEVKDNTILINSFSKTFSVTGWRVGYIAANAKLIKAVKDFQGHTTSNPSNIPQYGMVAALEIDHTDFLARVNRILLERLDKATKILETIPNLSFLRPDGAFYIYPNVKDVIGKNYAGQQISTTIDLSEILLEHAHVAVVPGDSFNDPDSIRISFAISKEDVCEGLDRIKKLFMELT